MPNVRLQSAISNHYALCANCILANQLGKHTTFDWLRRLSLKGGPIVYRSFPTSCFVFLYVRRLENAAKLLSSPLLANDCISFGNSPSHTDPSINTTELLLRRSSIRHWLSYIYFKLFQTDLYFWNWASEQ